MRQLFILTLSLLFTASLFAQTGTIRGTISDKETGELLMFTNVTVKDTDPLIGAQTDLDGNYEIKIDPGTYALEVSYVGYNSKIITDVEVKTNEVTIIDFPLDVEGVTLAIGATVTAKAIDRTENALLQIQRKAITVQDGISAQEISRFGSNNAAESMKRVTGASVVDGKYVFVRGLGDRYSSAQLNGMQLPSTDPYRNAMQLDLIPSNLLDNVIASKTFTPDQPGNFTGGNVNLKTKAFPERFTLAANISTSFNTQSSFQDEFLTQEGGSSDGLGFDDGTRDIPAILQSEDYISQVTASANIRSRRNKELATLVDQGANALSKQHQPSTSTSAMNHAASFSIGNQFTIAGNPLGVLVGLNYRKSYSHYGDGSFKYWELTDPNAPLNINRDLNDARSVETPQVGGMVNLSYKFLGSNKISFIGLYNHTANNDNRMLEGTFPAIISGSGVFQTRALRFLERNFVDYQLSGEHAIGKNGIKLNWAGAIVQTSQDSPDFRQFSNTKVTRDNGETDYFISPAEFDLPFHFWRSLEDEQMSGMVDLIIPLGGESSANKIQLGGFYSGKDRIFRDNVYQVQLGNSEDYEGNPDAFFGEENVGIIDFNENTERYTVGLFPINFEKSTTQNSYDGYENITAAYGMAIYDWDQFKVIAGARLENTDIFVQSQDTTLAVGEINQLDILPSLNLIYKLNDNMNVRATATQTLARPNMRELAPFVSFDFGGDFRIQGNPDLERTLIQNYDLRWEMFPNPGEIVAVSAYYKNFNNPIVTAFVPESANPLIRYVNVDQAQVYGVEVEFRKNLGFMGPAFEKFKFSTNVSLIESVVDIPEAEKAIIAEFNPAKGTDRPFQGQSPYLVNAALNYVDAENGWDAIVSFNVFGERLADISEGATPDIYEQPRPQLDVSVSKSIGENFGIRVRANNLLNPDTRTLMRFNGEEYDIQNFSRGTSFGISLSYKI